MMKKLAAEIGVSVSCVVIGLLFSNLGAGFLAGIVGVALYEYKSVK